MLWRVLFVIVIVPLGLPWGLCVFAQMIMAGLAWLVAGPHENRTERILEAPPAGLFMWPLEWLSDKAGIGF